MSTTNNSHYLADYLGGYATYNLTGGLQAATPPALIGGLGDAVNLRPERYIPVGQGFMVVSPEGSGSTLNNMVEFRNDQRTFRKEESNESVFFKSLKVTPQASSSNPDVTQDETNSLNLQRVRLSFTSPDGAVVPTLLGFTPDNSATDGFDYGYDAPYINTYPNYMCYLIEGDQYSIQGVGAFNKEKRYPIGIYLETGGEISIELTELENFDDPIDIYIYDGLNETYTHINDSDFELNLEVGEYTDRFQVVFEEGNNTLTIDEPNEKISDFNIYYASQRDKIVIMNPNGYTIEGVDIFNMLGQRVKEFAIDRQQTYYELPFYNIQAAAYIVHVRTDRGVQTQKFIVDGVRH